MPRNPSPAQIAAARANGARSRGPITPEGKAKSAQNSTSHGLTARAICLPTENPEQFNLLLQAFLEEFRPATMAELLCVEEMAVAKWKTRRIWSLETATLSQSLDRHHPDTPADASHHLRLSIAWPAAQAQIDNYSLHNSRLHHEYRRNLAQLERLQALRAAEPPSSHPASEAVASRHPNGEPEPSAQPQANGAPTPITKPSEATPNTNPKNEPEPTDTNPNHEPSRIPNQPTPAEAPSANTNPKTKNEPEPRTPIQEPQAA